VYQRKGLLEGENVVESIMRKTHNNAKSRHSMIASQFSSNVPSHRNDSGDSPADGDDGSSDSGSDHNYLPSQRPDSLLPPTHEETSEEPSDSLDPSERSEFSEKSQGRRAKQERKAMIAQMHDDIQARVPGVKELLEARRMNSMEDSKTATSLQGSSSYGLALSASTLGEIEGALSKSSGEDTDYFW